MAVETGRYIGIERKNRFCIFCSIKTCPIYIKNRNEFFINFAWANITLFINRMSTENKRKQLRIANLIYIALKQREKSIAQNFIYVN